jgi:hypothetical protein
MKTKITFIFLFIFLFSELFYSQSNNKIAGIEFPSSITFNKTNLIFNGGGLRKKYWIDLYVVALYLKNTSNDANKIINKNEECAFYIKIISENVTRERFITILNDGLKNATHGYASNENIKKFISFFSEEFNPGDRILLEYSLQKGIVVKKNGTYKGTIHSFEFKKALFSIWLGSNPVDVNFKNNLLGK